MATDRVKVLQVRVDNETAHRFSALAAATGMSETALLRKAVEDALIEAEGQIDVLQEQLRARIKETKGQV